MKDTPMRRLAGLLVLLGCLFALMVAFGTLSPNPEVGAYPEDEHLGANYGAWVGEKANFWGTVVKTNPTVVENTFDDGKVIRLRLSDTDTEVHLGDSVAVFGVVEPNHTLRVLNMYVIPATNFTYMYTVSFAAGVWVLVRLVRTWRIDPQSWSLEPRKHRLPWGSLFRYNKSSDHQEQQTEGNDA
ncbi:hypothetical protein KU306_02310 [Haloferax larsenii]|uniref:DUF4131 domain-containing protein n=1 Tax=Haloferax larsenii TaxID=302484 RepID=A0ABY5REG9_HALLR|nr:hypothetical protein [Haloferax larsenii]UVE50744.1 hypothetical protein KU306_02310 [Haloferax larsenii]